MPRRVSLNLDGFVYDRCANLSEGRLEWLKLQRGGFFPQPYRQLARVARAHGDPGFARKVGRTEGWEAPAVLLYRGSGLRLLFGYLFGFGLGPLNAFGTLLGFILVGWAGTHLALCAGALVVETAPVASVLVNHRGPHAAIWKYAPEWAAEYEPRCTNQILPLFYVLDLMLPAIPLHEETRCNVSIERRFSLWRAAEQIFSILGKIVTTLALITFSGVLNVRPPD